MLVVMTLLALFFGYHLNWIRQRRAAIATGEVVPTFNLKQSSFPPVAPGLLGIFGERGYNEFTVHYRDPIHREGELKRVKKLFPEAEAVFATPMPTRSLP
ncbi:hypothetical protein [Lacipirellula limnantheis]|uniref:Uncharacterized protein n=1 Tax=Lacipirellula limnantheis TaxID=2528024 RepID=A0A517TX63_9BACT|nr:hypothetical protein [Lacipirellula limnantheis]QDT72959.1 hypothetical protein I41_21460 [Lacipirellula limnantheis]